MFSEEFTEADEEDEDEDEEDATDLLYSRTDPYTEEEMRAID